MTPASLPPAPPLPRVVRHARCVIAPPSTLPSAPSPSLPSSPFVITSDIAPGVGADVVAYAACPHCGARGFGPKALGREQSWFTLCAVRQNVVDKAVGEHTQVVHRATRWFFGGAGVDAKDTGVLVRLVNGREIRVFLELGVIAGDEPGIKEMMSCKGHSGAKPCIVCQNCVLHTHTGARHGHGLHEHDPNLASIAETDVRRFKRGA